MALPIKTYWAGVAHATYILCRFINKHQARMIAVCAAVSPGDVAAAAAAFSAIDAACTLFQHVHSLVDPAAPPSE